MEIRREIKTPADRDRFYVRKAREYSATRFDMIRGKTAKKPARGRFLRLVSYQRAMERRADEWRRRTEEIAMWRNIAAG